MVARKILPSKLSCAYCYAIFVFVILFAVVRTRKRDLTIHEPREGMHHLLHAAASVALTASNGRRFVVVTAGTYPYRHFIRNFACSLRAQGTERALLLSFDRKLIDAILPSNIEPIFFESGDAVENSYRQYGFGSPGFAEFSRRKLDAVLAVLETGYDVLFSDGDVVWCTPNAVHTIASKARGDITFQYSGVWGAGRRNANLVNTGLYYARADERSIAFLRAARRGQGTHDQQAVNIAACWSQGARVYESAKFGGPPDFCVWNKTTILTTLEPQARFPNGCTKVHGKKFSKYTNEEIGNMCRDKKVEFIHYSCYASTEKRKSMNNHGLWLSNATSGLCSEKD